MCFSSLVLSRRPKIFKKCPQTLKNPLTPIGSCRELHILYKKHEYWEILFQKVALCYLLHFVQDGSSKSSLGNLFLHINLKHPKVTRPGFHLGAPKNVKLQQTQFHIKRYREILFQKVALCYLLHFVQDGSSKNVLEK